MSKNGLIGRYILVGAFAVCALTPTAVVRAQHLPGGKAGSIFLRYRFVSGQRLTYQVVTTQQVIPVTSSVPETGRLGAAASIIAARVNGTTTNVLSGQLHERVLSVNWAGVARVALTIDHLIGGDKWRVPVAACGAGARHNHGRA